MIPEELKALNDLDQIVYFRGMVHDGSPGSDVTVRWVAGSRTDWVQVHIQSDGVGKGGDVYSTTNYVSTAEVDCRESRWQTTTVSRNSSNEYYIFLIPVFKNFAGTITKFDGVDGADHMVAMELGR